MTRAGVRRLALLVVGLAYALSIPWYRRGGEAPGWIAGMPDWVAVALACYAVAALANALAWRLTEIPEEAPDDPGEAP